jgi:hypothetical protein
VTIVMLFAACSSGSKAKDTAAIRATTTTEAPTTTTTSTTAPPPPPSTTLTTRAPKPVEMKQQQCVDAPSQGVQQPPDDWAQDYETKPDPNQPMTVRVCIDDVSPKVGQLVHLTVVADDPDAVVKDGDCDIQVWWTEGNTGSLCRDFISHRTPPPPTPPKEHGHMEKTYTHTYSEAKQYLVEVDVASGPGESAPHPYDNFAQVKIDVTAHT